MADNLDGEGAEFVVLGVCERLRGGNDDGLARVDTQRVEVLHVADRDTVVVAVAHHLVFYFFPAFQALLHQHLRGEGEGFLCQFIQLLLVVAEARAESAEGIRCTEDDGVAQSSCSSSRLLDSEACLALDGLHINLVQALHEEFAVFGVDNRLHGCTKHLHAVFLQRAVLVKRHTAVEGSLSAKGEQNAIGALFLYYFGYEERGDGQEINLVCYALAGLHRGDIGVDEHCVDTFLAQGFQCLRAGVVKFTCLTNLEGTGTENKNFLH